MMRAFTFYLPERQLNDFRQLSQQTGESMAALMRRLFDHGLQEHSLNQIIPSMSGYLKFGPPTKS